MFELQREPVPRLAALGQVVELRELPYGELREAMVAAEKPGESSERLLGASLFVDGQPIGFEPLRLLPGRFAGAIAAALTRTLELHGLITRADADDAEPAADGAAGPKA